MKRIFFIFHIVAFFVLIILLDEITVNKIVCLLIAIIIIYIVTADNLLAFMKKETMSLPLGKLPYREGFHTLRIIQLIVVMLGGLIVIFLVLKSIT